MVHVALVVGLVGLAGALVGLLIGLLTFGVQATAGPHQVPLAVGPADSPAAQAVAAQAGDRVAWRLVGSRAEAESLLELKQVDGALLLSPAPGGMRATVLLSGALNPNATAVAQPVLVQVGGAVGRAAPVEVVTLHPTSAAGRVVPLAASALLWLATLIPSTLALTAAPRLRGGRPLGRLALIAIAFCAALLASGVVLGLARLWDGGLSISWEFAGLLGLVGTAFALLQAGVLRWLGLAGMAVLGPLYLMAPAVAGQAPELLDPVYKTLLWSWTPFRFSTEGLRSLLFLDAGSPDVQNALLVFAGIGLVGLLLVAAPRPGLRGR